MSKAIEKKNQETLLSCEKGAGFSEYLVLIVIVVLAGIAMWGTFSDKIEGKTNDAGQTLEQMQ